MRHSAAAITVAVLCILVSAHPAAAGPLAPTKPGQLVTAETSDANVDCPFTGPLGFSNGSLFDKMVVDDGDSVAFAIPAKQVFVITSFDFNYGGPVPGTNVFVRLFSFDGAGNANPLLQGTAVSASSQTAGGSVSAPSGIAVRSGKSLCVFSSSGVSGGLVHGFFAKK